MSIHLLRIAVVGGLLAARAAAAAPDTALLAAAESCAPSARALLERLVGIDSGTANVAGLNAMSAALTPELTRLGAAVERVPSTAPGLADSLLATWSGSGRGRVLLIAHMDTVFQHGVAAARPYRVEGERGIGPGAGDDKQGIVTALCAIEALRTIRFSDYGRIALILNWNEETGSTGSGTLIRAQAAASDSLTPIVVGSSADVSLAAATGTPSIDGFGALAGGAHGVDDYVDLASLVPRTYLLARMLMDLGANP